MASPSMVQRLRAAFERLIRSHQPEPDSVLIDRTLRNSNELIRHGRTYTDQLHMAEHFTLSSLPESLLSFVLDYENLHRATIRSGQDALAATNSPNMDVFTRVAHRILHLRLVYHLQSTRETRNPESRIQITQSPSTERELRECTTLLMDEIFRILLRLELVLPSLQSSYSSDELENIGPDHDVADFGTELALRPIYLPDLRLRSHAQEKNVDVNDPTYRCAICLDPYHPTAHPAFQIAQCAHIVGKTCLATWLNSTAHNANCCPHCRAVLCERRARRPKPSHSIAPIANAAEQVELTNRLGRALNLVEDVDRLVYEIFGGDEEEGLWADSAIMELNQRLFEEGVEFGFARDGFEEVGWRVRRVDWAAVEV